MQLRVQSPSNFHVSVESNLWLVQKTCATFSTNHKSRLGRLRFPSLQAVGCFYVEFSLALKCSFLPLTDRCRYFGLGFTKLNQKALFCWLKVIWSYCFTRFVIGLEKHLLCLLSQDFRLRRPHCLHFHWDKCVYNPSSVSHVACETDQFRSQIAVWSEWTAFRRHRYSSDRNSTGKWSTAPLAT